LSARWREATHVLSHDLHLSHTVPLQDRLYSLVHSGQWADALFAYARERTEPVAEYFALLMDAMTLAGQWEHSIEMMRRHPHLWDSCPAAILQSAVRAYSLGSQWMHALQAFLHFRDNEEERRVVPTSYTVVELVRLLCVHGRQEEAAVLFTKHPVQYSGYWEASIEILSSIQ